MQDGDHIVFIQHSGKLDHAEIVKVRADKWCRSAELAEPYGSKMGRFDYDSFLQNGYAESQGYTVYRKDFWDANRDTEIRKYRKRYSPKRPFADTANINVIEDRRLLGLPETGELLKSEIEQAYRVHAWNVHPDRGGSHEGFQKLGAAKEALLRSLQTL